ncbi:MAG: AraC family transcriptional regulator [Kiritimatiellae bacterium]|nr:AraC family transcriptional regulator [Kiritimatiellia bacterium]
MKLIAELPGHLFDDDLVACYVLKGRSFGDVWHYHPSFFELTLVRKGGTERWVGDKLDPIKPGDLVLLAPDLPHDYRNAPLGRKRSCQVEAVVAHFGLSMLGGNWHSLATLEPLRSLFKRARRGLQVRGATRDQTEKLFMAMVPARGIRRMILLLELLELLSQSREVYEISSEGFTVEPKAHSADRIGKACDYIEQNLANPVRVAELARLLGLSEGGFSRLFKLHTNSTVPEYVNRLRVAHACRLLAETDKTVSEVMQLCGYFSPAHFQRQFQRIHGVAPTAYRLNVKGGKGSGATQLSCNLIAPESLR